MTFDATSREFCQVRRVRTNTPLQALTLLNDPASFDAARALARRMMQRCRGGRRRATSRARAPRFGIKLVLSREATPRRADTPGGALRRASASHYQAARGAAGHGRRPRRDQQADEADLAAWTIVANVLLNLDEAVTKQ